MTYLLVAYDHPAPARLFVLKDPFAVVKWCYNPLFAKIFLSPIPPGRETDPKKNEEKKRKKKESKNQRRKKKKKS